MSILTINAGSSSLRLNLFAQTDRGLVQLTESQQQDVSTFIASVNATDITLVVHRVVHGGALLTAPVFIDATVEKKIEELIPLAPLHNPPALELIRRVRHLLGEQVLQVAVFDTAFYHALPQVAATYALPQHLCQLHNIRRYGFHGIAHQAMLNRWRELRPDIINGGRVISVQLGSGCSITAIDHGKPVDTSMGFSPLEGLLMATRSGDIDPAIPLYLQRQAEMSVEQIELLLNKQSGLLGVSGESNDMRVLLASNTPEAELAVEMYCYRVRKYIGAYLAVLGGADAILFGGGVGENSPQVREKILQGMEWLGVGVDKNSSIEVRVIAVDEARVMAQEALNLYEQTG